MAKRNLDKMAEEGKKHITWRNDLTAGEMHEFVDAFREKEIIAAIVDNIGKAYYAGFEAGRRSMAAELKKGGKA